MEIAINPVVGQWYRHPDADKGEMFQVVDIDAAEGTVEVQYFDGDIEELQRDAWKSQALESCAPPEDWTGPYDVVARDDLGYSDDPPGDERSTTIQDVTSDAAETGADGLGDEEDE